MALVELQGKLYRLEFWSDHRWERIPLADRPSAHRAHTNDGWFAMNPA